MRIEAVANWAALMPVMVGGVSGAPRVRVLVSGGADAGAGVVGVGGADDGVDGAGAAGRAGAPDGDADDDLDRRTVTRLS